MNLKNEFQPIRDWAKEKGILDRGDRKTQCLKLQEEVGELANAILKGKTDEFDDAVGDCVVVLTSLAWMGGTSIEECINKAYQVISKRTGTMQNGNFIKNEQ